MRQDLWILTALAEQLGLDWSAYGAQPQDCTDAAAAVFDEMRHLMPSIAGITWQRLQREGSVTYPCHHEGDAGERVIFGEHFPTPTGRGQFVPPSGNLSEEQPDVDYPLVLITARPPGRSADQTGPFRRRLPEKSGPGLPAAIQAHG